MTDEIKDTLVKCEIKNVSRHLIIKPGPCECFTCGSTEFCIDYDPTHNKVWVVCRRCDLIVGSLKNKSDGGFDYVSN